jgi:hypothetical protein
MEDKDETRMAVLDDCDSVSPQTGSAGVPPAKRINDAGETPALQQEKS